jgi:hypothetical protein
LSKILPEQIWSIVIRRLRGSCPYLSISFDEVNKVGVQKVNPIAAGIDQFFAARYAASQRKQDGHITPKWELHGYPIVHRRERY